MITWTELAEYVGAGESHEAALTEDAANAVELVNNYVGANEVPESIMFRAYMETGQALWDLRHARNGFVQEQFPTADGAPYGAVRVSRDPMAGAYKILAGWVLPW